MRVWSPVRRQLFDQRHTDGAPGHCAVRGVSELTEQGRDGAVRGRVQHPAGLPNDGGVLCLQLLLGLCNGAPAGGGEADGGLTGKITAVKKRLYDARGSVPPDRKANEDGVIPAHILRQRGDLRTGSRIVHFFAAAAVLVHPVEVCAGIGYSGSKLKDIRTRGFGELLRGIFGDAARGKMDD